MGRALSEPRLVEFGERLTIAREAMGLSRTELAALLDVSQQAVTLWETGERTPSRQRVIRLEIIVKQRPGTFLSLTHPNEDARVWKGTLQEQIMGAYTLTKAQRQILVAMVQMFEAENEARTAANGS